MSSPLEATADTMGTRYTPTTTEWDIAFVWLNSCTVYFISIVHSPYSDLCSVTTLPLSDGGNQKRNCDPTQPHFALYPCLLNYSANNVALYAMFDIIPIGRFSDRRTFERHSVVIHALPNQLNTNPTLSLFIWIMKQSNEFILSNWWFSITETIYCYFWSVVPPSVNTSINLGINDWLWCMTESAMIQSQWGSRKSRNELYNQSNSFFCIS